MVLYVLYCYIPFNNVSGSDNHVLIWCVTGYNLVLNVWEKWLASLGQKKGKEWC